jgi:hypothetical protein
MAISFGESFRTLGIRSRQDGAELLAPITSHHVRFTRYAAQDLADSPKRGIPGKMPIVVVVLLEIIYIQKQNA